MARKIEYMCRYCGKKEYRGETMGKPMPGKCRNNRNGQGPHSWSKNRVL